ncbi:MAG: hypothetical protein Q9164_002722 [Protoblastenia rupestris]
MMHIVSNVFWRLKPPYGPGSRSNALFSFLGEGIFTRWIPVEALSRAATTAIHTDTVSKFEAFTEHLNDLLPNLQEASESLVDLQPVFFQCTLATTTALIFGQPVKMFESDEQVSFASSFDYASAIAALRLQLSEPYWTYTPMKHRRACQNIKEYAMSFIKEALGNKVDKDNGSETKYAFDWNLYDELRDTTLVRDQLCTVLIAGRDTKACPLSWTS